MAIYTDLISDAAKRKLRFELQLEKRDKSVWSGTVPMFSVPCEFCGRYMAVEDRYAEAVCDDCDMYFHGRHGYYSDRIGRG